MPCQATHPTDGIRCIEPKPDDHEEHCGINGLDRVYWTNKGYTSPLAVQAPATVIANGIRTQAEIDALAKRIPTEPRRAVFEKYRRELAAQAAKEDALVAVSQSAVAREWQQSAFVLLCEWVQGDPEREWLPEDLWHDLGGPIPAPPEGVDGRALGPVVQRASRAGVIHQTGRTRPATRSHMQRRTTWTGGPAPSP